MGIAICIFDDKPLILVIAGDARHIGEASLFACVETGYWSAITLEKRQNKSEKNVVID